MKQSTNSPQPIIGFLIKFGEKNHMELLFDKGLLYCNTMQYFAELEDNNFIGDPYETVFHLDNIEDSLIEIKFKEEDEYKLIATGKSIFKQTYTKNDPCGNLFCTYHYDMSNQVINKPYPICIPQDAELKDYCVVITNIKEFVGLLNEYSRKSGISFLHGLVNYEDFTKYMGVKNQFTKDLHFQHQKEFRFWFNSATLKPLEINLGKSLKDIAFLAKTSELNMYGGMLTG